MRALSVTALRDGSVADLLRPEIRKRYAIAYWPGLDDLPVCVDAVEMNPGRVEWLLVDAAIGGGATVKFSADGHEFLDLSEWPLVLGEVKL